MASPQILVIDDDSDFREYLRIILESHGYRVRCAGNAREGAAAVESGRPDLIILDLGLPDMDGLDVLHRLREWTKTPVIILSVRDTDRDTVAALDSGADDYMTKPFQLKELAARGLRRPPSRAVAVWWSS